MKQKNASSRRIRRVLAVSCILALVGIGLYCLSLSKAATPYIAVEPENGITIPSATIIADTAASSGRAVKFTAPVLRPAKLMPLGDSITDGYVVSGGYRTLLWQELVRTDNYPLDFVGSVSGGPDVLGDKDHEGHSGWCIDGPCRGANTTLMAGIDGWLAKYKPDIIILSIGTNDIGKGADAATTASRLDALLGRIFIAMPTTHVILGEIISMNNWPVGANATVASYNASMPGLIAKYTNQGRSIRLVDNSALLSKTAGDYYPDDDWHPSQQGYDKLAHSWYAAVRAVYDSL